MKTILSNSILLLFLVTSINTLTAQIVGLWQVEKVTVGPEEMTPIARWMRFNEDSTQQSGNGWLQHSVGKWHFDQVKGELTVVNTNGYVDNNEPFKVTFKDGQMIWNRKEEGQQVTVTLKQIKGLPASPANQLLGVWDLSKVTEDGKDVTKDYDPDAKRYLFIRWDQVFMIQNSPKGRIMGVYKVHAHKPEMEMIPYGDNWTREFWKFEIGENELSMKLLNKDNELIMNYKRINYFPQ